MMKLLFAFYTLRPSSFYLLRQQLIKAVQSGKISTNVFYAILRKLRNKVVLDPDRMEVLD